MSSAAAVSTRRRSDVWFGAMLALAMTGSVLVVRWLDRLRPAPGDVQVLYLSSPKLIKRLSLGFHGLAADIYWTRAVQYFGARHRQRALSYPLLYPLLDIATQLDPHLEVAYEFGSIFLAQPPPEGAGQPQLAARLVERGIRENPQVWRLYYHLGYIQALELQDYAAAAGTFEAGSRLPGAHPALKVLAASMAQHGGEIQTARLLWSKIYESTDDDRIRSSAAKHLVALRVDEDVPRLEELVRAYRQRFGHWPQDWMEMVQAGLLRGIAIDPTRRPYRLTADGRVLVQSPDDLPFIHFGKPTKPDTP